MPFKKKPLAKKVEAKPTVVVETKKISSDCCSTQSDACCAPKKCCHVFAIIGFVLLVINTIVSIVILCNQTNIEAMKVGGRENYEMVKKIMGSEQFKKQQAQSIQQAYQSIEGQATAQPQIQQAAPQAAPQQGRQQAQPQVQ